MKKHLLVLILVFLSIIGFAQDYSIPMTKQYWTTTYAGPLEETASTIKCYTVGWKNGNSLRSRQIFNLLDKNIYIKWKKNDGSDGTDITGRLGIKGTRAVFDDLYNASKSPNDTWLYTMIHVNSGDSSLVVTTCTNNYYDQGGSSTYTDYNYQKVIPSNWHRYVNGVISFDFKDVIYRYAYIEVAEVIVADGSPKLLETETLYDFNTGGISDDITTYGTWVVDTVNSPNGNSMFYHHALSGRYFQLDVTNANAVKIRYKANYNGGSSAPDYETVTGCVVGTADSNLDTEIGVNSDGTTLYDSEWQDVIIPVCDTATTNFKLLFFKNHGDIWIDEIRVLKKKSSNSTPTLIELTNNSFEENSAPGTVVGIVNVSDADANDKHFLEFVEVSGDEDNDYFRFKGDTLILKKTISYEDTTSLKIHIQATDESLACVDVPFTINVIDVNEFAPTVGADQVFSVDENSVEGTKVGDVTAVDEDGDAILTFSITSGNEAGLFAIDSSTGEITVASAGTDYENTTQYSLGVQVSDGSLSDAGTVTLNVNDVNEAPEIAAGQMFNVDENSANETVIGTVSASDVDAGSSLSYSIISGDDEGIFTINSSTGKITFEPPQDCVENPETFEMDCNNAINLDYESTPQYVLEVRVSDNGSLSDTASVTIDLNNLNDNSPNSFNVAYIYIDEGATDGTVAYTVNMSDPDGDLTPLTFTVTSGHPAFEYENNVIKVKDGSLLDYETETQFEIKGYVSDGQSKRYGTLPFYIKNINDNAPVIESAEITIDEGTANGTVIYTLVYSDADGDLNPLTFTPTAGHDALDLSGDDIVVVDETKLDYETDQTITLTGTISDGTYSDTATLTIHLNNINDNTPVMSNVNAETAERSANGTVVATFDGTDDDGTLNALTYSFVSGQNHPAFTISGNQLVVSDGALLDHETEPTINMQVEISDGTNSSTADVVVAVTDIADDAPTITVQPQPEEVCEGEPASLSVTAEGDGTLSYEWLKDGVSMGKPDNSTLSLASDEIDENAAYSCKVTNEYGEDISSSVSVSVRALPVVDLGADKTITTNESVLLDAGAGFTTYMWSDDSDGQTLLFSGSDYGVGVHNVIVRVYDDLGCTTVDDINVEVSVATVISETGLKNINVYPNPATSGAVYVEASGVNRPVTIELISVSGQVVKIFRKVDVSFIQKLEISDVIKGMYLIHIFNDDYRETKRLIIR